ncbi:MAG: hypothetical protein J0G32_01670 [Alphaproteobacteria bacterium]|nr:hypothetical protein [Alphaproteobacteria bacterium]OJV15102.1 MAG: hypothetical protein BGO27_06660 [Alphaproteobacteria bacterium 33-17]
MMHNDNNGRINNQTNAEMENKAKRINEALLQNFDIKDFSIDKFEKLRNISSAKMTMAINLLVQLTRDIDENHLKSEAYCKSMFMMLQILTASNLNSLCEKDSRLLERIQELNANILKMLPLLKQNTSMIGTPYLHLSITQYYMGFISCFGKDTPENLANFSENVAIELNDQLSNRKETFEAHIISMTNAFNISRMMMGNDDYNAEAVLDDYKKHVLKYVDKHYSPQLYKKCMNIIESLEGCLVKDNIANPDIKFFNELDDEISKNEGRKTHLETKSIEARIFSLANKDQLDEEDMRQFKVIRDKLKKHINSMEFSLENVSKNMQLVVLYTYASSDLSVLTHFKDKLEKELNFRNKPKNIGPKFLNINSINLDAKELEKFINVCDAAIGLLQNKDTPETMQKHTETIVKFTQRYGTIYDLLEFMCFEPPANFKHLQEYIEKNNLSKKFVPVSGIEWFNENLFNIEKFGTMLNFNKYFVHKIKQWERFIDAMSSDKDSYIAETKPSLLEKAASKVTGKKFRILSNDDEKTAFEIFSAKTPKQQDALQQSLEKSDFKKVNDRFYGFGNYGAYRAYEAIMYYRLKYVLLMQTMQYIQRNPVVDDKNKEKPEDKKDSNQNTEKSEVKAEDQNAVLDHKVATPKFLKVYANIDKFKAFMKYDLVPENSTSLITMNMYNCLLFTMGDYGAAANKAEGMLLNLNDLKNKAVNPENQQVDANHLISNCLTFRLHEHIAQFNKLYLRKKAAYKQEALEKFMLALQKEFKQSNANTRQFYFQMDEEFAEQFEEFFKIANKDNIDEHKIVEAIFNFISQSGVYVDRRKYHNIGVIDFSRNRNERLNGSPLLSQDLINRYQIEIERLNREIELEKAKAESIRERIEREKAESNRGPNNNIDPVETVSRGIEPLPEKDEEKDDEKDHRPKNRAKQNDNLSYEDLKASEKANSSKKNKPKKVAKGKIVTTSQLKNKKKHERSSQVRMKVHRNDWMPVSEQYNYNDPEFQLQTSEQIAEIMVRRWGNRRPNWEFNPENLIQIDSIFCPEPTYVYVDESRIKSNDTLTALHGAVEKGFSKREFGSNGIKLLDEGKKAKRNLQGPYVKIKGDARLYSSEHYEFVDIKGHTVRVFIADRLEKGLGHTKRSM